MSSPSQSQSARLSQLEALGDETRGSNAAAGRPAAFRGVTPRAVILGLVMAGLMAAINPYTAYVVDRWFTGDGGLQEGPLEALLVLVILNTVLVRWLPRRAFSRQELLVTYGMLAISVALVYGQFPNVVTFLSYAPYEATAANEWRNLILPHVPNWLTVYDPNAVQWFWEGAPPGAPVPWGAWVTPLTTTCVVLLVLMAAMFCLSTLMSRDWIERQRLTFPMAAVPLALAGQDGAPTLRNSLLNTRAFWLGASVPICIGLLSWLHRVYPNVPYIRTYYELGPYFAGKGLPWNTLGDLQLKLYGKIIGIACLLPGEVSLSLWLFHVLYRVQMLIWGSLGFGTGESATRGFDPRSFIGLEEAGGLLVFSGIILYQSRRGLIAAWRGLRGAIRSEDTDPYCPLSLRAALAGFLLATTLLLWWLMKSGMAGWYAAVLLAIFYAYCVAGSRLAAAGGVMFVEPALPLPDVLTRMIGSRILGARSLTTAAYMNGIYFADMYQGDLPMAHMFNTLKLFNTGRVEGRRYAWVAALGVTVALAVGIPAILHLAYARGAVSMDSWFFGAWNKDVLTRLDTELRVPTGPGLVSRLALVSGAATMLGLVYMHTHYFWWGLSPIGFVIASGEMANRTIWGNFFIGWLISTILRRAGGLRLYRSAVPAFIGLALGETLTQLIFLVLNALLRVGVGTSS